MVDRLIPKQNIVQALHVDAQVSDRMAAAIDLWSRLYVGRPPWLFDKAGKRDDTMRSLNLPATIAAKVAKLVTLEMQASLEGGARATFLQGQLQPTLDRLRAYTEHACATGGIVLKPYIDGENLAVDITPAEAFFPTTFNGRGEVTAAVFAEQITRGSRYYTRLEYHDLTDDGYHILNRAYSSKDKDALGYEVPLSAVDEWASLEPEATVMGIDRPLFAYFRIPQANTIDPGSPLGVSVFARAAEQIKETDKLYSNILWEYEGSQLAIDADLTALLVDENGRIDLPERDKRLFRNTRFQGGATTGDFYKPFSPAIRDQSLYNGLNKQLQQVELACGLSFGTLSDPQNVDKTATEIKASKQDMYTTISDIQKSLQAALRQLVYAMDVWTTLGNLAPAGGYQDTYVFDDSVINDPDVQKQQDSQDVRDGLLAKWEYRMKWYGEDEKTARARIAEMNSEGGIEKMFGDT